MANPEHVKRLCDGVTAWNAWREANPAVDPDLSGADLSTTEFRSAEMGTQFFGPDLTNANLSGAALRQANLREARLHGANLRGADLLEANLLLTNLIEANLSKANLSEAYLGGAYLHGANLSQATCHATVFSNVDLSRVVGIETIDHRGPSTIGVDTLFKSDGKIPDVFLRGAGVPEIVIEYLGSMIGKALEFYSCFISYSHADRAFARRLHDALQGRGIRCWLDEHQLLPGDVIRDQISEAIKISDKVLFCASHHSLASWWVDKELTSTFAKEERLSKKVGQKVLALIPLNLDGSLFTWESGWADEVMGRLAADFTGWETDNAQFEVQFERMVKALRSDQAARPNALQPKLGERKV